MAKVILTHVCLPDELNEPHALGLDTRLTAADKVGTGGLAMIFVSTWSKLKILDCGGSEVSTPMIWAKVIFLPYDPVVRSE